MRATVTVGLMYLILLSGCISSPDGAVPPQMTKLPFTVYGELNDFHEDNNSAIFKIRSEFVNWKPNRTNLEINVENLTGYEHRIVSDLKKGSKYAFYIFTGFEESEKWIISKISENFTEYQQDGIQYRKNDLKTNQMTTTEGGGAGPTPESAKLTKVIPTVIEAGTPTELQILLVNSQDYDIKYRIRGAKIVNEVASQWYNSFAVPPYEERLRNATIDECKVSFDAPEYVIRRNTTKMLIFIASCPKGVNVTKTYEECDSYKFGANCSIVTTNRNNLMLWGEIEFTDGVGNKHVFPSHGVLKQSLQIKEY